MYKNIAQSINMSCDKLTLSIEPKKIDIEPTIGVKTISVNALITELILPIIAHTPELKRTTTFSQFNKDYHWNNETFHIFWRDGKSILPQFRGSFFNKPESVAVIETLMTALRQMGIDFHITECDYQTTFLTNEKEKLIKEMQKTKIKRPVPINDDGLSVDELMKIPAEKGLVYYTYGRNPFIPETSGFKSTVYSINLYNKNIQLRQQSAEQSQNSKREFYTLYGNEKDMFRLEHSYTRKAITLARLNEEIQLTLKLPIKTLNELFNDTDKYTYTKKFLKLINQGEKIK